MRLANRRGRRGLLKSVLRTQQVIRGLPDSRGLALQSTGAGMLALEAYKRRWGWNQACVLAEELLQLSRKASEKPSHSTTQSLIWKFKR